MHSYNADVVKKFIFRYHVPLFINICRDRQGIVFERFLLPIVNKKYSNNKEAKASQGDSPRMSENTISCLNTIHSS